MKKIILGVAAICLLSTTSAFAAPGKKKNKRSKTEKIQCCKVDKCCDKTATCPPVSCCTK